MKIYKYGDNVDTDVIIPARYLNSFDAKELASHAMVDIDPDFAKLVDSMLAKDPGQRPADWKKVRAAFDAYIFLSYRKKDRRYANELMKLIHSHPQCRDIAIWYDEFLTPGENFRVNIEKILKTSKLFPFWSRPICWRKRTESPIS